MFTDSPGHRRALDRIAQEKEKRTGFLDLGNLGLTGWMEELWTLDHLTGLNLGVGWLDETCGFHFAAPGIDAAQNTLPAEEAQWHRLPNLRILSLAGERGEGSPWGDLAGLDSLTELRALDLSFTDVNDLTPLSGLPQLQVLDASYTFIDSLAPLAAHSALRHLDLSHTKAADLTPLTHHPALQTLLCYHTPVASVAPLAGLPALKKLDLTQTQVTTLDPLAALPSLETLHCAWTPVETLSESLVRLSTLRSLILHETAISNFPVDALSPDASTSCLESVRAWLERSGQGVRPSWPQLGR